MDRSTDWQKELLVKECAITGTKAVCDRGLFPGRMEQAGMAGR